MAFLPFFGLPFELFLLYQDTPFRAVLVSRIFQLKEGCARRTFVLVFLYAHMRSMILHLLTVPSLSAFIKELSQNQRHHFQPPRREWVAGCKRTGDRLSVGFVCGRGFLTARGCPRQAGVGVRAPPLSAPARRAYNGAIRRGGIPARGGYILAAVK